MNRVELLLQIYDKDTSDYLSQKIDDLLSSYRQKIEKRNSGLSHRDVLLITYANSILEPEERPLVTLKNS